MKQSFPRAAFPTGQSRLFVGARGYFGVSQSFPHPLARAGGPGILFTIGGRRVQTCCMLGEGVCMVEKKTTNMGAVALEVAGALGLRPAEVARVLKDPGAKGLDPNTRKKILDHLARKARVAQGPTRGRNLFLVLPEQGQRRHQQDYFEEIKNGLLETLEPAASARKRDLVVKLHRPRYEMDLGNIPAWGVVVASPVPEAILTRWAARFPVVAVNRAGDWPGAYPNWDRVSVDNQAGMELMAGHLAALGHRRVAFICPEAHPQMENGNFHFFERQGALSEALERRGLVLQAKHTFMISPKDLDDQGAVNQRILKKILKGPGAPTALCFGHDALALRFISFCRHLGLEIPRQISVCGFDGTAGGLTSEPSLTTMAQDYEGMARAALSLIEERNRSGVRLPKWHVRLSPHLVVRASTAPAGRAGR